MYDVPILEGQNYSEKIYCISRESNPELGHGKTQCYRYTTDARMSDYYNLTRILIQ